MTAPEAARLLAERAGARLLDVRQAGEFEIAHIAGATLIPLPELPFRLGELHAWKEDPIVVLCHHGVRSRMAAGILLAAGFREVHNLDGGIDAWSQHVDSGIPRY